MNQLICAYLSHTHYWYEVGMLKVYVAFSHSVRTYLYKNNMLVVRRLKNGCSFFLFSYSYTVADHEQDWQQPHPVDLFLLLICLKHTINMTFKRCHMAMFGQGGGTIFSTRNIHVYYIVYISKTAKM